MYPTRCSNIPQITRINEVKRMSALMLLFATIMEDNASDAQEDDNIEYPSKIYVKKLLSTS